MKINKIRQGRNELKKGRLGFKMHRIKNKTGKLIPYNPKEDKTWNNYFQLSHFERRI